MLLLCALQRPLHKQTGSHNLFNGIFNCVFDDVFDDTLENALVIVLVQCAPSKSPSKLHSFSKSVDIFQFDDVVLYCKSYNQPETLDMNRVLVVQN